MHVEQSPVARTRGFVLTSRTLLRAAIVAVAALYVVVASGAIVRLTASGLGCDNWPRCGDTPFPAKSGHAVIEFSNRVVALATLACTLAAWLVARRVVGAPRHVVWLTLAAFVGTAAQIPLGGLTVLFELHPLLVMAHFLLALVVLGISVVAAVEAWSFRSGLARPLAPTFLLRLAPLLVVACLALVVTGAFATAAGPHPGGEDIRRHGVLTETVYVHVRATAVFGVAFLVLVGYLWIRRRTSPLLLRGALAVLGLIVVQMAVGEVQWRTQLPWWLVLAHVALATAIWGGVVALVTAVWRPPAPLVRA